MNKRDVAAMIDHTILKPEATQADVARIVEEGAAAGTFSVCVSPSMLPLDVPEGLKVACVVGFPSGAVKPQVKAFEAAQAVADGADEIDMVINIGFLKDGRYEEVEEEIKACEIVTNAGAEFIKTSTGFSTAGATFADVELMKKYIGKDVKVKAAGGISSFDDAEKFISLGAERLGTSRLIKILKNTDTGAGY